MRRSRAASAGRQQGLFAISTALAMRVLQDVVGLAMKARRMQRVQAELRNAADSCALAAALERHGLSDAPGQAALAGGAYSQHQQSQARRRQAFRRQIASDTLPAQVHTQFGACSRRLVSMAVHHSCDPTP